VIIRPEEPALSLEELTAGLKRAARGVVLVERSERQTFRGAGTGWMVTEWLALTAHFVIAEAADLRITARAGQAKCSVVDVIQPAEGQPEAPPLALLRVDRKMQGTPLPFSFDTSAPGDLIFVVHYPQGEPHRKVTIGHLLPAEEPALRHDANTEAGSGGAPVFDHNFRVIGMHEGSSPDQKSNTGISRAAILSALRRSKVWPEIAAFHRIADVKAAHSIFNVDVRAAHSIFDVDVEPRMKLSMQIIGPSERGRSPSALRRSPSARLRCAVRWSFDPSALSVWDRAALAPLTLDPSAPRWTLQPAERIRILRSAASLEELREARGDEEATDTGQRVIDYVLRGGPFERAELAKLDESSLSHLLQVSRWFAGVVPSLPTPAEVNLALQRKRVRSRLDAIAGPGFRGRKQELAELKAWFESERAGPMIVTGIGGMGKSALVARFTSDLPPDGLLLWLDFDRPDLAPDDAVSVLTAIAEQAAVQIDGLSVPPIEEDAWRDAARALGRSMAEATKGSSAPPLLVLDSFEAAQYIERYQELWPVLEVIGEALPSLRVIVTGRADVKGLSYRGRPVSQLKLGGLERGEAAAWLKENGIGAEEVLGKVLSLAGGMPLILLLAARLVNQGGEVMDLPSTLAPRVVEAVLYERILGRMKDRSVAEMARGALVLRRLTVDMIRPVLGGLVEIPEGDPAKAFAALGREMALVEPGETLRLRADLRAAVLWLLEHEAPAFVRKVDEKAAEWYAQADSKSPEIAAELVYHRLRLSDLTGAAAAWQAECALFLQDALDEMPEGARSWLRARVGVLGSAEVPLEAWEVDARRRIQALMGRGMAQRVAGILRERAGRSPKSPLVFFDAWVEWQAGNVERAAALLDSKGYPPGSSGRDRAVLRALLAVELGDRQTADQRLTGFSGLDQWLEREDGRVEALAVRAARVRLTFDLEAELRLLDVLGNDPPWPLGRFLSSIDVCLPALKRRLGHSESMLEARPKALSFADDDSARLYVRADESALRELALRIKAIRRGSVKVSPQKFQLLDTYLGEDDNPWSTRESVLRDRARKALSIGVNAPTYRHLELAFHLLTLSLWRWRLVTASPLLADLERQILFLGRRERADDEVKASLLGTLALFAGDMEDTSLHGKSGPLDALIEYAFGAFDYPLSSKQRAFVARMLNDGLRGLSPDPDAYNLPEHATRVRLRRWLTVFPPQHRPFAIHLVTPDPLESLVRRLAGTPLTST
jgi:hypothetical protein